MKKILTFILSLSTCFFLISCKQDETESKDNGDGYITNGLIMEGSDESGTARIGLKCLNKQNLLSEFLIYAGHSYNFSDLLSENYLSNYGNASFCAVLKIYDYFGKSIYEEVSFLIRDFIDKKYSYSIEHFQNISFFHYPFSINVKVDFSNFSIDVGMICFVLSLVNSDGEIINDFDASYGIDDDANLYFAKKGEYILFDTKRIERN